MSQSRTHSAIESIANTATGFLVSWGVWTAIGPMYGFEGGHAENLSIVCIFTVTSMLRSYLWRRAFNRLHGRSVY